MATHPARVTMSLAEHESLRNLKRVGRLTATEFGNVLMLRGIIAACQAFIRAAKNPDDPYFGKIDPAGCAAAVAVAQHIINGNGDASLTPVCRRLVSQGVEVEGTVLIDYETAEVCAVPIAKKPAFILPGGNA